MNEYLALLLGITCAGVGGELFVRGAVGLGHWARISPGIIGATVAAFATSSPELSVAVSSALAGTPQIALGDALGSNVVNVALILALALVISGIQSPRDSVKRDFPVALLAPVITGILFLDGELSRGDGLLMLAAFIAWLVATVIEARKQRSAADEVLGERRVALIVISCAVGLAFLVAAGNLIVTGAKGIAMSFGVDEFIIGATIVAIGTSAPELATTVVAKLRGHDEVGLGTILGSNIFNGMFIVAVAATIHPITVAWREVAAALVFGLVVVALIYPSRTGFIERRRGLLLLALYAIWLATILQPEKGAGFIFEASAK
ncbi:MAG: sodium:calcium antiporter [Gammaproteobacteria bacterium]|nr:sodium:calcium antiporter [Gammaproteobacteria bacterium]